MRICVVDDEKQVRESIIQKLLLLEPQAEIFDVGFGKKALEQIMLVKPDLVFLDILMPEIDGLSILRAVKEQLPHATVAMLSGYSEFEHARKAIQFGAIDYLLKPADREQMKAVTDKVKHNMFQKFMGDMKQSLALLANRLLFIDEIKDLNLSAWFDEREWKIISFDERGGGDGLVFSFQVNRAIKGHVVLKDRHEGAGFHDPSQFAEALLICFEQWEAKRFWQGERQQPLADAKRMVDLRHKIISMAKQGESLKESELEFAFAEWIGCLGRLNLKALRKEAVALMALLDEGMADPRELVAPDADKLRYWTEWVHQFQTWTELRGTLTKYVVQGIRALAHMKSQPMNTNWIDQAVNRVNSSPIANMSLDSVAAEVGVHPVTLSRMFKKQTGINFVQFLTKRRLNLAKSLLLQSDKPVSEVAEEVGYLDPRYFRVLFKKEFGMTPGDYRSQHGRAAEEGFD